MSRRGRPPLPPEMRKPRSGARPPASLEQQSRVEALVWRLARAARPALVDSARLPWHLAAEGAGLLGQETTADRLRGLYRYAAGEKGEEHLFMLEALPRLVTS